MVVREPQAAGDYDDRTTAAVKSVLIEIGQILGNSRGQVCDHAAAPFPGCCWAKPRCWHVGHRRRGPRPRSGRLGRRRNTFASSKPFRNKATFNGTICGASNSCALSPPATDGPDIDVVVDFLMPRDAEITRNTPPLISQFAVQRADGADLALRFYQMVAIEGHMPDGDHNRVNIAVASIPALLAMKGYAIANRLKRKDAYDIYYSVRNFPDGIDALVEATRPLLDVGSALQGYSSISEQVSECRRFRTGEREKVRRRPPTLLGDRTADQWQQDAFGQVDAWLRGLGLRQVMTGTSNARIRTMDMPILDEVFVHGRRLCSQLSPIARSPNSFEKSSKSI